MRYSLFLFLSIVIIQAFDNEISAQQKKSYDASKNDHPSDLTGRLSEKVLPQKYSIAVSPDFQKNIFYGSIRITCKILEIRDYVALHSKGLSIDSTSFCRRQNHRSCLACSLQSVYPLDKFEMIVLNFTRKIQPGIYTIAMNFSGSMDNRINGFYLSTYKKSNDRCTKRKLAVTQFEPTYARKAFPCFDEPAFKSIFEIKIIHSTADGYHAMSNMPSIKVERASDRCDLAITSFAPSLPMSSYLVAFLVSDFTCITSVINSLTGTGIPVSVCSSLENKRKIYFALRVATRALTFYMNFFQIDFPLPKIDLVGVPDFAAGAMENWGLVTFRETEILQSEENSSIGNTKSVALTVSHELAHMWFGNLVTLEWWNDLWLNEGFATYMEYLAVNYLFPRWKEMESFPLETKYLTMRSDSKITAHPIIRNTENSDEIGQMFDHISYQKGAAVLRMLEDAMGKRRFIRGIREYLATYKFENAATKNLFEILQKHFDNKISLLDFMKTWTELPGFPVLKIRRVTPKKYEIFQKRFFNCESAPENSTWDLPIRYITDRKEAGVRLVWFLGNASCAELSLENPTAWIKLNHRSIGYYIVDYSEDLWSFFGDLLSRDLESLNPLDRADLLHDSLVLADSGHLRYNLALSLTKYLINETVFQPWLVAASWILRVDRLLSGTPTHRPFRHYARYLIEKMYNKVGWNLRETEDFDDRELRILVLRLACSIGHVNCLRYGEEGLKIFLKSNGTIRPPADLRSIVYSFGLMRLGPENLESYEKMWEIFVRENDPQEKERLLIGLADVREPAIIAKYLERVADENFVRRQNFFEAIGKIASNPTGLELVWNFLRKNWEFLAKKYTLNDAALGSLVGKIVSSFKDSQRLKEAEEFFTKYPDAGAGYNSRRLALEESSSNIKWLLENPTIINRWLESNYFRKFDQTNFPK